MIKNGATCCLLVGAPNYYSRLGFTLETDLTYKDAANEYFQKVKLQGEVTFNPTFY